MRDSAFGKGPTKGHSMCAPPDHRLGGSDGCLCSMYCVLLDIFVMYVGKTDWVADIVHFGPNTQSC